MEEVRVWRRPLGRHVDSLGVESHTGYLRHVHQETKNEPCEPPRAHTHAHDPYNMPSRMRNQGKALTRKERGKKSSGSCVVACTLCVGRGRRSAKWKHETRAE